MLSEGATLAELAGRVGPAWKVMDAQLARVNPDGLAPLLARMREDSAA